MQQYKASIALALGNANAKCKGYLVFQVPKCIALRALALGNANATLFYHSKTPLYHYTIPFSYLPYIPKLYFY